MVEKKQFRLSGDLEQLVQLAGSTTVLRKTAETKHDNDLIDQAKFIYTLLHNMGVSSVNPKTLGTLTPHDFLGDMKDGEGQTYKRLENLINSGSYKTAKEFYLRNLDEQHKLSFYVDMLEKDMMPEDPGEKATKNIRDEYEALKKAKAEVDVAEKLEKAAKKGDSQKAIEIAREYLDVEDLSILERYGAYGGPTFRDGENRVYLAAARARRNIAKQIIKEKNLYSLIDKGITKHEQGKAYSLVGMYSAYQGQLEFNKRKKQAEQEAKRR